MIRNTVEGEIDDQERCPRRVYSQEELDDQGTSLRRVYPQEEPDINSVMSFPRGQTMSNFVQGLMTALKPSRTRKANIKDEPKWIMVICIRV